jgi:NAD dependent epimerase/dehydratase family enzyme
MVSWIHADDFCRLIDWLIVREDIEGVINAAAPRAVSNRALMVAMREAAERPFGFPASRWMLEVGAWALGTETELILKSRWVAPRRLLAEGFSFRWSTCREAIGNLAAPPALPGRKKGRVRRTKTLSRHVS